MQPTYMHATKHAFQHALPQRGPYEPHMQRKKEANAGDETHPRKHKLMLDTLLIFG